MAECDEYQQYVLGRVLGWRSGTWLAFRNEYGSQPSQKTNVAGIEITNRTVLILDEVDGMSAGDRGGIGAMNALIRKTKVSRRYLRWALCWNFFRSLLSAYVTIEVCKR
jgi:hypothetical protein